MSEYQCCEFQALDRRLSAEQQAEVKKLSMNVEEIELKTTAQYLILSIGFFEGEGGEWIEGDGLLDPLLPLRDNLLRGDLRVLYLAWLRSVRDYDAGYSAHDDEDAADDDEDAADDEAGTIEPPVPAGLGELSPALLAFAEFLDIDQDVIAAAAETSPPLVVADEPFEQWIGLLSPAERDAFLLQVARDDTPVKVELLRRLRELGRTTSAPVGDQPEHARRSWAELKEAAKPHRRQRLAAEREAAERARLAKLEALAAHEEHAWLEVDKLLAKRSGTSYDQAAALLAELRDLARHRGNNETFARRLTASIAPVASSSSLQRRLREKKLVS